MVLIRFVDIKEICRNEEVVEGRGGVLSLEVGVYKMTPAISCTGHNASCPGLCTRCRVGDKSGTVRVPFRATHDQTMISFLFWHHFQFARIVLYHGSCLRRYLSLATTLEIVSVSSTGMLSILLCIFPRGDVSQCEVKKKLGRQRL